MENLFEEIKLNFFTNGNYPKFFLFVKQTEEFEKLLTCEKFKFKKVSDGVYYLVTTYGVESVSNYLIKLLNTKVFVLSELKENNIYKYIMEEEEKEKI